MKTLPPPLPAVDLPTYLYCQLVYTLTDLLPPPLDDTPGALRARNHAAVAKVAARAACVGQSIEENVSEDGINSHDVAFETWVSEQPWNRRAKGSGETSLHEVACEAMAEPPLAKSRLTGRNLPATGRDSPGRAY